MIPEDDDGVLWYWRCRDALHELPEIMAHIRVRVEYSDGRSERGDVGRVVVDDGAGGQVQLLGLREESTPLRVGAVDDADQAYAELVGWVEYWAERLGADTPVPVAWSNAREVQGLRAGTSAAGAFLLTRSLTLWLLVHHLTIADDPRALRYFEDFTRMVWGLRARYPLSPGRTRMPVPRLCPTCGSVEVRVSWFSAEDVTEMVVRCDHCGWTPPRREVARVLRKVLA